MTPTFLQYCGAGLVIIIGLNGLFRPIAMGKAVGLLVYVYCLLLLIRRKVNRRQWDVFGYTLAKFVAGKNACISEKSTGQ